MSLTAKWSVLIVEDDQDFVELLSVAFDQRGISCHIASDVTSALRAVVEVRPNIVISDIGLSNTDGWRVVAYIRDFSNVPILIIGEHVDESNVVRALEMGATDLLFKPISPRVLVARVFAILRGNNNIDIEPTPSSYDDGYLIVEPQNYLVSVNNKAIKVSRQEFKVLSYIVQNAGRVLSIEEILENAWGWEYRNNSEYVHVYLSRLRKKIEPSPKKPRYFVSVYGIGYRFESMEQTTS